jgi:hypothetical protein
MQKENCRGAEHNKFARDPLAGRSSLSSPHQSIPAQLHCIKTLNTSNHRHHRQMGKALQHPVQQHLRQQEIQKTGLSVRATSTFNNEMIKVATVVQQIMTELSEALSEKKNKITVITKIVLNLMNQNDCQSS